MNVSLKCEYAIRGLLELARHHGQGTISSGQIAGTYSIPKRFLEVILNELAREGMVGSKRGVRGGYFLAVHPRELTVGDIVRLIDGPPIPVKCTVGRSGKKCPLVGRCALRGVWNQARQAVEQVYDSANFEELVKRDRGASTDFSI